MKITEKIVTSVTQPQLTNVLWHNPETGELKMFGNNGWEVVGGAPGEVPGGGGTSGGYPVVTIKDNFNIEAKPNTFYDIKNPINSEIIITCNPLELAPTKVYFTCDGLDSSDEFGIILSAGLNVLFDDTKEGYNYKALVDISSLAQEPIDPIEIYFTNDIIQGGSTVALINMFGNEIQLSINNINIIKTENIVNEFIFNVNCPCSIEFANIFSWNNGYVPDLTKQGICTISIVNGVGCYTFVNS